MGRDSDCLGPVGHSEFLYDVVYVVVDGSFTYPQDNRYVGLPLTPMAGHYRTPIHINWTLIHLTS